MAIPALPHEVPPWTIENYVLQNSGGSGQSLDIAPLEHINAEEPYSHLWAAVHKWLNGMNESFNGKFRDECLNMQWFKNRIDAKILIEEFRRQFNETRPHSALGNL